MLLPALMLAASLALLVKSADVFTDSAEKLATLIGVSPFIIGATIASIGTSLPELATGMFAVLNPAPQAIDIVIGNVIGSNIANIALVLGIAGIVAKLMKIRWEIIRVDIPLLTAATLYLWFTASDGIFTAGEGVLALLLYLVYFAYTLSVHGNKSKTKKREGYLKPLAVLALSGIGIAIGALYAVEGVVEIAGLFGISPAIIAVTVVAVGTSLPELVVSVNAAMKKKYELAIGNITGSCIFNALVVTGIPALVTTLSVPAEMTAYGLPFLLATLAMFIVVSIDKKVGKYEGYGLLALYALFIAKLFGLF